MSTMRLSAMKVLPGLLTLWPVLASGSDHFNQLGTSPAYQQMYQQYQQQQYQRYRNPQPAVRAPVYNSNQVDQMYRSNERYLQQYPGALNTYPHTAPQNTSRRFEVDEDRFTRSAPTYPSGAAGTRSTPAVPSGTTGSYGMPTTGRVLGQDDW